jgi:hypothetical protein
MFFVSMVVFWLGIAPLLHSAPLFHGGRETAPGGVAFSFAGLDEIILHIAWCSCPKPFMVFYCHWWSGANDAVYIHITGLFTVDKQISPFIYGGGVSCE